MTSFDFIPNSDNFAGVGTFEFASFVFIATGTYFAPSVTCGGAESVSGFNSR